MTTPPTRTREPAVSPAPTQTPAQLARFAAGLSIEEAAERVGVCIPYLRRLEKRGAFPYVLAVRCAREYACALDVFAGRYTEDPKSKSPKEGAKREQPEKRIRERRLRKGEAKGTPLISPALPTINRRISR